MNAHTPDEATPPKRDPYYFENEIHDWPLDACARGLIWTLCTFVDAPRDFKGHASVRAWIAHQDTNSAHIAFTSDKGDGHVEVSTHESHWVKVEVFVSSTLVFRAWADEPWEEKEFWPDGADGVVPPNGDPPGRISKRGSWVQLRCADFGIAATKNGLWDIELADA